MPLPSIVVCGHVTLDVVAGGRVPGGTAWYGTRALAALGAAPRLLTSAGPDLPREALAGLDVEVVPSPATTVFANAYDAAGVRTQRVLSAAAPLEPARLPVEWRGPDVLFLATVLREVDVPAFAGAAGARIVGLVVQGLVRDVRPGGAVAPRRWEPDPAALAAVDVAVLSDDDARGQGDLVARLAAALPVVAFTHGVDGCDLFVGGRATRVGVYPTREVDPTGAGDVFAAGLLLGLARGDDPVDAARLGAAAASVVVEARGGDALGRVGEAWNRVRAVSANGRP